MWFLCSKEEDNGATPMHLAAFNLFSKAISSTTPIGFSSFKSHRLFNIQQWIQMYQNSFSDRCIGTLLLIFALSVGNYFYDIRHHLKMHTRQWQWLGNQSKSRRRVNVAFPVAPLAGHRARIQGVSVRIPPLAKYFLFAMLHWLPRATHL